MKKSCIIISGGKCESDSFLSSLDFDNNDVICCDAGFLVAKRLNLKIKAIIGDFDTLGFVPDSDCEIITFPKEKDDTDTMLAAKYAVECGYESVRIICALGGRVDHLIANIQTLAFISKSIPDVRILSDDCELLVVRNDRVILSKDKFMYFSVFSYSDVSEGIKICGAKYQGENLVLTNEYPMGACNEFADESVEISCENGTVLIILANDVNLL